MGLAVTLAEEMAGTACVIVCSKYRHVLGSFKTLCDAVQADAYAGDACKGLVFTQCLQYIVAV